MSRNASYLQFKKQGIAVAIAMLCITNVSQSFANQGVKVPDLLKQQSSITNNASASLQLGIVNTGARLVSVGERGIVLLSDDDGVTWHQASHVPVSVTLTAVSFANEMQGWAVGHSGVVLHTADGGDTWRLEIDGNGAAKAIFDEATLAVNAALDGAETALENAEYLVKEGADKPFLAVKFIDEQHGLVTGAYGLALETLDGGEHWHSIVTQLPNPNGNHLYAIDYLDGAWIIAGEQGAMFEKVAGAERFTRIDVPYQGSFFGIKAFPDRSLLAYGLRGNVWQSNASHTDWKRIEHASSGTFTNGMLIPNGILIADETGSVYFKKSQDSALQEVEKPPVPGITDLVIGSKNTLIFTGPRGNSRIPYDIGSLGEK